jgi:hypothetical protein
MGCSWNLYFFLIDFTVLIELIDCRPPPKYVGDDELH